MEDVGGNIHQSFLDALKKSEQTVKKLPTIAANRAKNFFQDRFRDQAWYDTAFLPWKKRKANAPRNKGRAILTDTGHLKRGIKVAHADWDYVEVRNDVPYASAHNFGVDETVQIHQHTRATMRRTFTSHRIVQGKKVRIKKHIRVLKGGRVIQVKTTTRKGNLKIVGSKLKKVRSGTATVRTHSRHMKLPQRQFMGDSDLLNRLIERDFQNELKII